MKEEIYNTYEPIPYRISNKHYKNLKKIEKQKLGNNEFRFGEVQGKPKFVYDRMLNCIWSPSSYELGFSEIENYITTKPFFTGLSGQKRKILKLKDQLNLSGSDELKWELPSIYELSSLLAEKQNNGGFIQDILNDKPGALYASANKVKEACRFYSFHQIWCLNFHGRTTNLKYAPIYGTKFSVRLILREKCLRTYGFNK